MDGIDRRMKAFRVNSLVAIVALALEFILGMYTALFVRFPEGLAGGNAWGWAMTGSSMTVAHVALGTALLLGALSALGFGVAARSRTAIVASAIGLALVGLAYLSGTMFLADIEKDAYSFSMALGFIGAMLAYGAAYHLTRR